MRGEIDSRELPDLGRPIDDHVQLGSSNNPQDGILRTTLGYLSLRKLPCTILHGLKPEFLRNRKNIAPRPGPTAWLDGLRGCAAFSVCIAHLVSYTHWNDGLCYGHELSPEEHYRTPTSLPFIRILFSGQFFSVILFFFISGYVLTKRLITLIHQERHDEFIDSLHSALCRRPGRLFLPVIWSTLTLVIIWHITGIATPWPPRQAGLFSELNHWYRETLSFLFPFREGILYNSYNSHTWTIPVEMRGSMIIYIWLFASSRFSATIRTSLTLVMTLLGVIYANGAWYSSFLAGLLTAELDLIYADEIGAVARLPTDPIVRALRKRPILHKVLLHVLLFVGLYLAGQPFTEWHKREDIMKDCMGWETLNWLIPSVYDDAGLMGPWRWFWLFWAAWFTMAAIKEIPWIRQVFETGPAQCTLFPPLHPLTPFYYTSDTANRLPHHRPWQTLLRALPATRALDCPRLRTSSLPDRGQNTRRCRGSRQIWTPIQPLGWPLLVAIPRWRT